MTSYNTSKPSGPKQELWRTVEIGWKHTVVGDEMVYETDENGDPVPNAVRVPARVSPTQIINAAKSIGPERLDELAKSGGIDLIVELVGAVIGSEILLSVAKDQSVSAEDFTMFVLDTANRLGLAGDSGNPTNPAE